MNVLCLNCWLNYFSSYSQVFTSIVVFLKYAFGRFRHENVLSGSAVRNKKVKGGYISSSPIDRHCIAYNGRKIRFYIFRSGPSNVVDLCRMGFFPPVSRRPRKSCWLDRFPRSPETSTDRCRRIDVNSGGRALGVLT